MCPPLRALNLGKGGFNIGFSPKFYFFFETGKGGGGEEGDRGTVHQKDAKSTMVSFSFLCDGGMAASL